MARVAIPLCPRAQRRMIEGKIHAMRQSGRLLASLPLVALALSLSSGAMAQTRSSTPGATALGAPGSAARSDITFSLNARYDNNVPRLNDLQPNVRNLTRSDVKISPVLRLDVARNLGRQQVGLRSQLGYDFYTRNSDLDRERLIVEPYAYLDLPVCDVSLQALASRQLSDLGELTVIGIDPTIALDNTEIRKRVNARLICGEAYGLRPTFEVERASGDNSNPLRQIADYRTTRYQPGIGYSSPTLGEISVYAFKTDTDLPNQFLPGGRPSGYSQKGYGLSYGRALGTRLRFSASISNVEVQPFDGSGGREGVNGSVSITLQASDRLQFVGFANRSFTSTLTSNATYELSQGYGLTANYAVNDRLRLRAGGQVSPRTFFYAVQPIGPFIGKQTQYDIFAGATYQLNPRLRVNFDTGAQRRDADLDLFDYRSFYAAIGIAVSL